MFLFLKKNMNASRPSERLFSCERQAWSVYTRLQRTVRRTTTYSYCCITNLFTLACPPLSSIKYDTEHLVMLGSSLGCSRVGDAPEASEILDRRNFSDGAF